ncbi:MAG: hypothetical protein V3R90_08690 [Limibaculum sp.]
MPDKVFDFDNKLFAFIAKEATAAHGHPEQMGAFIERLARGLGFTIALASGGQHQGIDDMCEGAEGYMHSEAVGKSSFAAFMAELQKNRHAEYGGLRSERATNDEETRREGAIGLKPQSGPKVSFGS